MTSLRIKGTFVLTENDQNELRMGISLNGLPGNIASNPAYSVIMSDNSAGNIVSQDTSAVSSAQLLMITANNSMYQRRRLVWVKLKFIPKFNSFIQENEAGISTTSNDVVFICTDSSELENFWGTMSSTSLLANNTGIRTKSMYRPFKIFNRTHRFPMAPKYEQTQSNGVLGTDYNISGIWRDTSTTTITGQNGHIAILATGLNFGAGTALFDVVFEIKYAWADRRSG